MTLATFKTTDFLSEYEAALNWIQSIGVKMNKASRLEMYRKNMDVFTKVFIAKSQTVSESEKEKILRNHVTSFIEAEEIVYIVRAFSDTSGEKIRLQLQKVLNGPISSVDEVASTSSNQGRNFAFELYVASLIKNSGHNILDEAVADLLFEVDSYSMFIECKRPLDAAAVEANVMKANRQLKKRFSDTKGLVNKRGLVALSLTKIFNPDQSIYRFPDENTMHSVLQADAQKLYFRFRDILRDKVDRRVVGWVGLVRVPVIVDDNIADFSMYNYPIFVNITHSTEPEHTTVNALGKTLQRTFQNGNR